MKKILKIEIFLILIAVSCNTLISLPDAKKPDISTDSQNESKIKNDVLKPSQLAANYAILIDIASGEVLFDKNSDSKCYPASTTKILTALLVLENISLDEEIIIGDEANLINPDSSKAGIRYGEKLSIRQLLHCLLIASGNDAAYSIAVHTARKMRGDEELSERDAIRFFSDQMNLKAIELGAINSHFNNPDGFHNQQHYSTAHDIALIALKALGNSEIREVVRKESFRLPDISDIDRNGNEYSERRLLLNTNRLLLQGDDYYPYATGMKTGHTDKAGFCLVSTAEKDGRSVLAVVMKSTEEKIWLDSRTLLEYGLRFDPK